MSTLAGLVERDCTTGVRGHREDKGAHRRTRRKVVDIEVTTSRTPSGGVSGGGPPDRHPKPPTRDEWWVTDVGDDPTQRH